MNLLTVNDYLMGRDIEFPLLLSLDLRKNAERMVDLVNRLCVIAQSAGVTFDIHPTTLSILSSGWRPPEVNATTKGAAKNSLHLTCEAADIFDPDGELDDWLMTNDGQRTLVMLGLWMEHPGSTRRWSHVQCKPPRSRNRVFYP